MKKAAKVLEKHKSEIVEEWIDKVREEVAAARENNELALRDHVPHLVDDIISIMRRYEKFDVTAEENIYEEIFENSIEHGRHRATSSGYTVNQILREYISFHRILTNKLLQEEAYNNEVGVVIKYSIENAMLFSGSAFSDSLQEMRQKLIGILAHDIRNPISAAYLAVDMMKHEQGQERFEKIRQMAKSSLKRSIDLVEGLLDSIAIQAGEGITLEFSETDLYPTIQSVHSEAKEIYSNEIILNAEEKEIKGIFDATMIRRVLENFISNAVKYGNRDKPVTMTVINEEEIVTIGVNNYGTPIPEEKQEDIFRFLSTTGSSSGSKGMKSWGMGLTLVKAVAEAHGGELKLESDESNGTTFTILINKRKSNPGKVKAALNYEFRNR